MKHEYRTTCGEVLWDDRAYDVEHADNPKPPDDRNWVLCGSVITETRLSKSHVLWFWKLALSPTKVVTP